MRAGEILGNFSEGSKHVADASLIVVGIGALFNALPKIAALFTVIWLAIRIWESDTIRAVTRRPLLGKRDDD